MGSVYAQGLRDATDEGMLPLSVAISVHLTNNHYPPISTAFVPMACRAVERARGGDTSSRVKGPKGWRHSRYGSTVPIWALIEELHLEAFV